MLCPHCKTDLQTINLKDTNIDICPSCHGVWLDKGELEKLIETHAPIFNGAGQADENLSKFIEMEKTTDLTNKDEKLWEGEIECPICGKLMQKSRYAVTSDIVIDSCQQGCGVWLDKGEILRIADYLTTAEKPLTQEQKELVKERLNQFNDANKEKVSPLEFLNKRYYSETELEKDLNTTPTGQYVSIIRMVVEGLLYFLMRRV
jgi:uncharacterized protein